MKGWWGILQKKQWILLRKLEQYLLENKGLLFLQKNSFATEHYNHFSWKYGYQKEK